MLRNAGNASLSKSGKALNIGIRKEAGAGWDNYTIALSLLEGLLRGESRRVPVSKATLE